MVNPNVVAQNQKDFMDFQKTYIIKQHRFNLILAMATFTIALIGLVQISKETTFLNRELTFYILGALILIAIIIAGYEVFEELFGK